MAIGGHLNTLQITKHFYGVPSWDSVVGTKATANADRSIFWWLDDNVDRVTLPFRVPDSWSGKNSITVQPHWSGRTGAPIGNTETVAWGCSWVNLTTTGLIQTGTATVVSDTYTQSGAGAAGEIDASLLFTLDKDDGNNGYVAGDLLTIRVRPLTAGSTYDGGTPFSVYFLGALLDWS